MTGEHVCPVCGSRSVVPFLDRSEVPVHQHVLFDTREAAIGAARGRLLLTVCPRCGFVSNSAFDESKLSYGFGYDNSQYASAAFREYTDSLARHLLADRHVKSARIVEIGCGNGAFLAALVTGGEGNVGRGFDPSHDEKHSVGDPRLVIEKRFYDETCDAQADVVICRHVIEHIARPVDMLRVVRRTLDGSPAASVYFETPCVEWILDHQVAWDFFYEHCSYFTASSLKAAFELSGFAVRSVDRLFGSQYLWIEAEPGPLRQTELPAAAELVGLAQAFAASERANIARWRDQLRSLRSTGRIALWGAGAKGVTFANLIDPDACLIDCVVDLNPNKQGRYLPGTGHPIVGSAALSTRDVRFATPMNPNYRDEIAALLRAAAPGAVLVDLEMNEAHH